MIHVKSLRQTVQSMRAPACLANAAPPPEDAEPLWASNARRVRAEMDEDPLACVRLRTQLGLPVYRQREQTLKSVSAGGHARSKRCGAHKQRRAFRRPTTLGAPTSGADTRFPRKRTKRAQSGEDAPYALRRRQIIQEPEGAGRHHTPSLPRRAVEAGEGRICTRCVPRYCGVPQLPCSAARMYRRKGLWG